MLNNNCALCPCGLKDPSNKIKGLDTYLSLLMNSSEMRNDAKLESLRKGPEDLKERHCS